MWFARTRQRFADWRTFRETVHLLNTLDTHILADVGIGKRDIRSRARAAIAEKAHC